MSEKVNARPRLLRKLIPVKFISTFQVYMSAVICLQAASKLGSTLRKHQVSEMRF